MKNTRLSPAGHVTFSDVDSDKSYSADTLQCVHCGQHWAMRPGSGNVRGFCTKCSGPVCGPKCGGKCVPQEQQLENIENGLPADHVPLQVGYTGSNKIWVPGDA